MIESNKFLHVSKCRNVRNSVIAALVTFNFVNKSVYKWKLTFERHRQIVVNINLKWIRDVDYNRLYRNWVVMCTWCTRRMHVAYLFFFFSMLNYNNKIDRRSSAHWTTFCIKKNKRVLDHAIPSIIWTYVLPLWFLFCIYAKPNGQVNKDKRQYRFSTLVRQLPAINFDTQFD